MSSINGQNIERMRVNGNEIELAKINGNVVFQKNKLLKTFFGDSKQNTTTGKNLLPFPYSANEKTQNGINFKANNDGSITINGTSTGNAYFALLGYGDISGQVKIEGNYISGGSEDIIINVNYFDGEYHTLATNKSGSTKIDKSVYEKGYIEIYIPQNKNFNNYIIKPILSYEIINYWEPYTGGKPSPNPDYPQKISSINGVNLKISNGSKELKIPINLQGNILAKVGDYADELQIYSNGDIVLNKKIEKTIFDGDENWVISSLSLEGFSSFYIENILDYNKGEDDIPMICDYFIQKNFINWEGLLAESFIENASNTIGIRLPKRIANSLTEFKNWLQSNNIEVYYVLQNSTTTKVDNIKSELNSFGDYSNIEIEVTYS